MLRPLILTLALLSLTACAHPQKNAQIAAGQGLIIIEAEPAGLADRNPYFLTFSEHRPEDQGALGEAYRMDLMGHQQTARTFYVKAVPAGAYLWEAFNVGYAPSWGLCLNGGTYGFDVSNGQAVYLGRVDPQGPLADVRTSLPAALSLTTYKYVFDRQAPPLDPTLTPQKQVEIATFLAREHPDLRTAVRAAELRPMTFRSGPPALMARFPRCALRR